MSPTAAQLLWLAGIGLLAGVWAFFVRRRAAEPTPVPRAAALGVVALALAVALGGAAAWGGLVADDGLRRAAEGNAGAPARARLFLRHVQLYLHGTPLRATVGYGPSADLRLPRDYGLDEAGVNLDVFTVEDAGPRALRIAPAPGATTRVLTAAVAGEPDERTVAAARRLLLDGRRCRPAPPAVTTPDGDPLTFFVLLCDGDQPRAMLAVERELGLRDRPPGDTPLRVTPFVWRPGGFRPHHVHLEPGTLLQIGAGADALPGVVVWEIPAPAGRPGLLFPPRNLLAPCSTWLEGNLADASPGGFFYPGLGVVESPASATGGSSFACVLPFTPPFALEVRRLLPDTAGVWTRSLWASSLLALPVLCVLLLVALERGSRRSAAALARLGGLTLVSVSLAALGVLRLLLAHRLDMMRDYEPAGARVVANEVEIVLLGAALAAAAVALGLGLARRARLGAAAAAWAVTLVAGAAAVLPDVDLGPGLVGQAVASLALGTSPAWWGLARARLRPSLSWPLVGLFAIAVVVTAALLFFPRAVAIKLGAAWALPPLAYLAIRERPGVAAAIAAVDLLLLLALDTGVGVAIGACGLLVAAFALAGDALYRDADARILDGFARRYAPVIVWQALALLAFAATVIAWAGVGIVAAGPESTLLPLTVTHAALHVLLPAAALFAGTAALLYRRGDRPRAAAWAGVALALAALWAARDLVLERVLGSDGEASARVAAIVDPAYALISDERAFAKGLTAWRETAAPGVPVAEGAGYFGAQVLDAGVLLSIENDYLPVLVLREAGAFGLVRLAWWSVGLALALWLVGAGRFAPGSSAARARRVVAALLGIVFLYQPVASLGVLPLTGISWPGLGIDSPTDLWIFAALLFYLGVLGEAAPAPARVPARSRRLVVGAAAAVALAAVVLVARVGVFAMGRLEPVAQTGASVRLQAPFEGIEPVLDYVYRMQCAPGAELARPLLGQPDTPALERYQEDLVAAWERDEPDARARLERIRAGDRAACAGREGAWRFERRGAACAMTFKVGWPETRFIASADGLSCDVEVREDVLRAFRYPPRRPYAGARVRLVSRAAGDAARDRGELVSGAVVVRLRPGAGLADATFASAGAMAAEKVTIGEDVEVVLEGGEPAVRRAAGSNKTARLLVARVHQLEPSSRWETRLLDPGGAPTPLAGLSVIVVGGSTGRNIWMFRPTVDPLLADDVMTVLGSRRRHYVYGGLVPELGWVNPRLVDKSLGLDGWTHAAVARWERGRGAGTGPSAQARFRGEACGLLAPPVPESAGAPAEAAFARVCAPSVLDGVLECRVSLQPELETRLRHLLELTAQRPEHFARAGFRPATVASFALLRGDTGEILAQAHVVPGRESTAYAPATPGLERLLLASRESRQESGAEKADWPQPIAIGSTMKPFLARAFERAAPAAARGLQLSALGPRAGCQPILGHCPPTVTLWNHVERPAGIAVFLGSSLNWFQAAIGLLGTALPGGEIGFGDGPAESLVSPIPVERATEPLWTRYAGRDVIRGPSIDLAVLRSTPMWRELEALVGRPMCTGSKASCARAGDRRDLCAARALPVEGASADLRHLVALGPATFDFADDAPVAKPRQLVKDYLQFLRGSGKHPLASTLQLADVFNRLVFDAGAAPYALAASWFPVEATGTAPPPCRRDAPADDTVAAGLCLALTSGTASQLAPRLDDPDLVFYGAKTGTIDSLGDIVERRASCERWNRSHTIPGAASQPYHLDCRDPDRGDLNDSLLVLSFGVKQEGGVVVPLTLALRYQRAGSVGNTGYAVYAADAFLDVIADYFD